MEKKNGSGEKWGGRSLNAYTHFSLFQLPRTSQRGSLISFFWQLKRPFPTRKIDLIWLYKNKYQIEKNMSGWEWDRVRVSRLGTRMGRNRNNYSTLNERVRSTRTTTVRLGHVTPQAPGHRTIYCNDREANQPVRFKVWRFLSLIYLFFFWIRLCLVAEKIWRKVESLYGWRIVEFDCVIAYMVLMMDKIRIRTLGG